MGGPGDPMVGDPMGGDAGADPMAGDPNAGMTGDPMAGDPMGADPMAGDSNADMGGDPMGGDPMGGDQGSNDGDLLAGLNDSQKDAVEKYANSMKNEGRFRRMYDRIINETIDQIMSDRVEPTSDRYEKRMPKEYKGRKSPFISPY